MQSLDQEGKVVYASKEKKDKQELPSLRMAGQPVLPHPEQGGTGGEVLRILQHGQRLQFK
jgi:hypothetical protein